MTLNRMSGGKNNPYRAHTLVPFAGARRLCGHTAAPRLPTNSL